MSSVIHLVLGPVGAGKSTFAAQLCAERNAVFLNLDEWMATLYGADERPSEGRVAWYMERVERCIEQIWRTTGQLVDLGVEVVLELGLVRRADRFNFYQKLDERNLDVRVYVLDAPPSVRWERVRERNEERGATFCMTVPRQLFDLASAAWEGPDEDECEFRSIQVRLFET